jgi:hypothetical protein
VETVAETQAFQRSAKDAGMSREEIDALIDTVSADPAAGELIVGSGGCRKLRVAGRGKGKSGGYRVITFHAAPLCVYLLWVISKGDRANVSDREVNEFKKLATTLQEIARTKT